MYNKNVYKYDDMKRGEHMAVRTTAGWYFWTHELVQVTGEDAAVFLDLIFTGRIMNLKVGSDRYTTALNEKAEIIDDVVVLRMGEREFWVSTLFARKLIAWMNGHKGEYKVAFENVTPQYQMYAVQGPRSLDMVNALVKEKVDEQKFFTIRDNTIDGVPVKINRAGFTGEKLGYEIYIASDKMEFLEEKLKAAAVQFDAREVTDIQIMTGTLPTEAGFYYMRDMLYTNPFEVGMTRGIGWDKEFIGKEALLKIKEEGPAREMVGFMLENDVDVRINGKDQGSPGSIVTFNGEEIGRVSKFNYSFVKEKPIGYLLVDAGVVKTGDHVTINKLYDAVICDKNFL